MTYPIRFLLGLLLVAGAAQAKPIPALSDFTREQVTTISQALNGAGESESGRTSWEFKRFLFRVVAKVAFDVEIAKIEAIPELELVWQKEGHLKGGYSPPSDPLQKDKTI